MFGLLSNSPFLNFLYKSLHLLISSELKEFFKKQPEKEEKSLQIYIIKPTIKFCSNKSL